MGLALSRSLAFFVRHVRLLAVVGAAIFVPVLLYRLDLAERAWKRDVSRGTVLATFAVFVAVCAAVTYHDLRRVKDGVGIEDLLEVFE